MSGYKSGVTRGNSCRRGMSSTGVGVSGIPDKIIAWWDAGDTGAITSSSSAVSDWLDETGTYTLSQTTAGLKPTLVASGGSPLGGVQYIDFDGGDLLTVDSKICTGSSGEVWASYDVDVNQGAVMYGQSGTAASNYVLTYATIATAHVNFANFKATANQFFGSTTTLSTNTSYVSRILSTSTSYQIGINGTTQSLTFPFGSDDGDWFADDPSTRSSIGCWRAVTNSQFFDGQVKVVILVDAATLSTADATAVRCYMQHDVAIAFT